MCANVPLAAAVAHDQDHVLVLTTYDEDADILRACAKLGVSGRTAAVAAATERGLLWHPAS